jgi:membrane-associated phospholipid phosphatase
MESKRAAEAISTILNPLFVAAPTLLALLILEKPPNLPVLALVVLAFGTVVPLAILYGLVRRGALPDMHISNREDRSVAFVSVMSSYVLGAVLLLLASAPPIVTAVILCYLGNSLIMMLISIRWKISIHASGITGPVTVLTYSLGVVGLFLFGLTVPVGWARIRLGVHTLSQVVAGALLTIATTWLQLRIYLTLL